MCIKTLHIAISTDAAGFRANATLIASILRRTSASVHVRCWCRGFTAESFERENLKVEFIDAVGEIPGRFPGYVGPAVFDRLRVIRDCPDWDRCLIMDYDQVAFCDLAPLFDLELGDQLLAAKMQGPGVDLGFAMREWIRRPMPEGWEAAATHPYFSMGPLLNLAEMRKAGTWEKLMAAQAAFQADENLALVAATDGRTMDFDPKWNLFPPYEVPEDGVPDGVVHWLGWPKPWHEGAKVWRPELWESERCSWEHLRMGLWEKPLAVEVEPDDDHGVEELLKRGWKVRLFTGREGATAEELPAFRYPDLEVGSLARRTDFIGCCDSEALDRVRFGPAVSASEWLAGCARLPRHVIVRGPCGLEEVRRLVAMGYGEHAVIRQSEWPAGGPMARVLDYVEIGMPRALDASEEWYLRCCDPAREQLRPARAVSPGREISEASECAAVTRPGEKVAVVVTACGAERRDLPFLLDGIRRHFLPGVEKRVFVFSDGKPLEGQDLTWIRVEAVDADQVATERLRWLLGAAGMMEDCDFIFLFKPQVRVRVQVAASEVFPCGMVAVLHEAYEDEPRQKIRYEENRESAAWIGPGEGRQYFCGSWQGGRREKLLAAVRWIVDWMAQDEARGTMPIWADESYWNRYWADLPPDRILGADHAWRAGSKARSGRVPKVQVLTARERQEAVQTRPNRRAAFTG